MKIVVTSGQMAQADQYTIQKEGIPGIELMERAAQAAVNALSHHITHTDRIAVFCGGGNNGGDGYAMARLLADSVANIQIFSLTPFDRLKGDARTNWQRSCEIGLDPQVIEDIASFAIPGDVTWIVDALFGTGLSRPLSGPYEDLVALINHHRAPVMSVDLPSGLCGDHGAVIGPSVRADLSVTFAALKKAHVVTPASTHCGMVMVKDIGIRFETSTGVDTYFLEPKDFQMPSRKSESHKGIYGTLAVIGGGPGMEGAANLAARASLRFGVGKVRILTPATSFARFNHDAVMVAGLEPQQDFSQYSAVVVGPGLGRQQALKPIINTINECRLPSVWDADALFGLEPQTQLSCPWVMTPHPGEAAALLDCLPSDIQGDRLAATHRLAERFPGATILLKGYRSIMYTPQGHTYIFGTGGPALATAGSGDVLAGMIGSLLAQGLAIEDSVSMAVLRHGLAADRWTQSRAEYAMIADDIIDDLKKPPI